MPMNSLERFGIFASNIDIIHKAYDAEDYNEALAACNRTLAVIANVMNDGATWTIVEIPRNVTTFYVKKQVMAS